MSDGVQEKILSGLAGVLRPLIRAVLRSGIGYKEFSDLTKNLYVEVATNDFGIRGRPTNMSRVSVMTGISRKEVSRIRKREHPPAIYSLLQATPVVRVLHCWTNQSEFSGFLG